MIFSFILFPMTIYSRSTPSRISEYKTFEMPFFTIVRRSRDDAFSPCSSGLTIVAAFVLFAPATPKLILYSLSFIVSIFEEALLFANLILSFPFEVAKPEKSLSFSAADETSVLSISSHFPSSVR